MNLFAKFEVALGWDKFLARYGTASDRERWRETPDAVNLTAAQTRLLSQFRRATNVLVLAGAWCGDCAIQCPIFERFAAAAPVLTVRYLDRDDHPDVQSELRINGGDRIPVAVFFSEDGHEVGRYGDKTLNQYRALAEMQLGEPCAAAAGDELSARVTQDWLEQFERVQWMLRLSPRLRRIHGE